MHFGLEFDPDMFSWDISAGVTEALGQEDLY